MRTPGWFNCVTLVLGLGISANVAAANQPDHAHVSVTVVVPRGETSASGDALGIYALQLLPCEVDAPRAELMRDAMLVTLGSVAERLLGVFVGVAHANHRERFDGLAQAEFGKRVALDVSAKTEVGVLVAPIKRFCSVGLVLARLAAKNGQPEVPYSLRLSSGSGQQVTLDFRQDINVTLDKPWVSTGQDAKLVITLRPRRAHAVFQMQAIEDGERMQRVALRLAADADATIGSR